MGGTWARTFLSVGLALASGVEVRQDFTVRQLRRLGPKDGREEANAILGLVQAGE
jgi:hypothetical protein